MRRLRTSESVTEGHPDKICDKISDAILDNLLKQDPLSRVAVETCVTNGIVFVAGEITTSGYADIQHIVRSTLKDIGYTSTAYGMSYEDAGVLVSINRQSPEIAQGVDNDGAGDQGLMYGFACDETEEYLPLPIALAHRLAHQLSFVRKQEIIKHLGPDGKTQVTVEYDDNVPLRVDTVVIAQQHTEDISEQELRLALIEHVIKPVLGAWYSDTCTVHINATGRFVIGGPAADTGLTGRKIIVDTYGGIGRHGGGAFSGKDPSKVDRSAAYAARYVAKNIVASGLASRVEVGLSYAIGVAEPVSIHVDSFGTGSISDDEIVSRVRKAISLTPKSIIERLDLRKPVYYATAAYGHFGREGFSWEQTDLDLAKEYK